MEFVTFVLGLLFFYTLVQATLLLLGIGKPKNLPPGPTPLPIIGSLHLFGDHPHQSLAKLANIHGPIMSLQLGRITTLVISSADAAKEVLQKQDIAFSTRHAPDALNAHNHSGNSVVWIPIAPLWRTLRKILNTNIFSGNSLDANQHLRSQKVHELVTYCRKASESNEYVDIGRAAFRTSLNLLSNTIVSKDLINPYEDSGKEFKEVYSNIMIEVGKPNLVDFFPLFKKMDPQGNRRRLTRHFGKVLEMFEELMKERLAMKRLKPEDVLDVCLKIHEENPKEVNRAQIKSLLLDLFVAGTDTASNTLEWAMTEVLRNPDTMAKAKDELEKVIGKGEIVDEKDLSKLPYLQCIVKETLRIYPSIPFLIPRKLDNQVKLDGYTIPKVPRAAKSRGTAVMRSTDNKQKHFVLVHGLCHGAWCWFKLKPLLEAAGHRVSAIDLSASGTDTKVIHQITTFANYTRPLLEFMATVPPEEKVVLVGHSLGGMNIALAMENFAKKVSVAIFLAAFMPDTVNKPSYVIEKLVTRIPSDFWLDTQFVPYTNKTNSEVSVLLGPKFVSLNMYQLCSDEDQELGKLLFRPGSLFLKDLPNTKEFTEDRFGSVRRVFVITDEDKTIPEDYQKWMIQNSPVVEVKELKSVDHIPMLSDPKQLAVCLLDIVKRNT